MNKIIKSSLAVIILVFVSFWGMFCHSDIIEKKYRDQYTLANLESLSEIENIETGIGFNVSEVTAHTEPYYSNNGNGTISIYNKTTYECKGEGPINCPMYPKYEFVEMFP